MVRMDYGMVGKEIFLNKLEASKQWEDLDWDGQKISKRNYGRWSLKDFVREECALIKEAKALRRA